MNDNVRYIQDRYRDEVEKLRRGGGGDEPPGDGKMEKRVDKLESSMQDVREKLIKIEAKVESIDKHGATKADLSNMESTLIKWFIATAFALTATTFGIVRFLSH
jgi:50S ribosomal subunit-associated GTPase HflX